jgi:hypothetical protein
VVLGIRSKSVENVIRHPILDATRPSGVDRTLPGDVVRMSSSSVQLKSGQISELTRDVSPITSLGQ